MVHYLLVLIFIAVSHHQTVMADGKCDCGNNNNGAGNGNGTSNWAQKKITALISGGQLVANISKWPWLGALMVRLNESGEPIGECTASIIGRRFLLTAAHCDLFMTFTPEMMKGYPEAHYVVAVGSVNNVNESAKFRRVKRLIKHPNYPKMISFPQMNDIAVLELEEPLEYGPNIQPICLARNFDGAQINASGNSSRLMASIAGWGMNIASDIVAVMNGSMVVSILGNQSKEEMAKLHEGKMAFRPMGECALALAESQHATIERMNFTERKVIQLDQMEMMLHQLENMSEPEVRLRMEQLLRAEPTPPAQVKKIVAMMANETKQQILARLAQQFHSIANISEEQIVASVEQEQANIIAKNTPSMLCAQGTPANIEKGDSGGPLMLKLGAGGADRRWFQVGINQAVITRLSANQTHYPSFFTNVAVHCDWIGGVTNGEAQCQSTG